MKLDRKAAEHDRYVTNILRVWEEASAEDHVLGAYWYLGERDFCDGVANRTGLALDTVCAIHAILSPRVNTVVNRTLTESLIDTKYAPTFDRSIAKCLEILEHNSPHVGYSFPWNGEMRDYETSCNGPKVCRFFLTILSAGACEIAVVDRHMADILEGVRRISESINLDDESHYRPYELAILDAARTVGVPAHVLQATTWISWRRLHGIVDSYTILEEF